MSKIILSVINEMVLFVVMSLANELSYRDLCPFCLAGPHLLLGEKVLLIRKDFADGSQKIYKRKKYLAGYSISPQKSEKIDEFISKGNFNPMSLLWFLSEFALIKFCNGI